MDRDHRDTLIHLTSVMMDYLALREAPKACDIIWGLGSNDERVALKAVELYREKLAPLILFSGGKGHRWKELTKPEAQLFKEAALRLNAPASAIIVENKSSHTGENVAFSLRILDESRIPVSSALLITIPPFQRRASLTVKAQRKSIQCVNCPISWGSAEGWNVEFLVHAAQLCVGEIKRLQEYPGLGYIDFEPGQIPSRILECGEATANLLARTR